MPISSITPLPPAPSTSDPDNFSSEADALLSGLVDTFVPEMNTAISQINSAADTIDDSVDTATVEAAVASAASAASSASASIASAAASAAVSVSGGNSTSTTSVTIGTGSKSFTVQTGKSYVEGMFVQIARTSAPSTTYMSAIVVSYNGGTGALVTSSYKAVGSGTHTDWSISVSAPASSETAWIVITADPGPAVSGGRYQANTTSAAFPVTLPPAPTAGTEVTISDYIGTFSTNNLTIARNGSKIMGETDDVVLSDNWITITAEYIDSTIGWRLF